MTEKNPVTRRGFLETAGLATGAVAAAAAFPHPAIGAVKGANEKVNFAAIGVGGKGGFLDAAGRLPRASRVLLVDSLAAVAGGLANSSSNTTYIESGAGVAEGAKTGLASLVTAILFLLSIFLASIAGIVPQQATAPVLMLVGWFMFKPILDLNKIGDVDFATGFAVLLTVFVMPLTYSITNGIGAGFVAYVLLKTASGKMSEVSRPMLIAAIAFAVYFADPWIRQFVK